MSAGSPTVRLLLLAPSIPLSPSPSPFSSLFPSIFPHLYVFFSFNFCPSATVCLHLFSSSFLHPSTQVPSFLSSTFLPFASRLWLYSRRSREEADFPVRTREIISTSRLIYKENEYFFILIVFHTVINLSTCYSVSPAPFNTLPIFRC